MRMPTVVTLVVLGALVTCTGASPLRAQEVYGRIRGTVTDPSGAVVPDAQVTVTNTATGVKRSMNTSPAGAFEFDNLLAPAAYAIDVERQGFQNFRAGNIQLNINQVYVSDVTLQVGSSTQTVTIEAAPNQINTTGMELGTTVTSNTIVDMPLNGRNWLELQQLQPGTVAASDRFGNGANGSLETNFASNGAETQQNAFYVNGVDTADISLNTAGIVPSPDAIGEFHMVTSTINPEYGRNSGAIMNAVIKNGTNRIHGDGFEFYRDTFLDARQFFQLTTPPFHQNQFGGTIGGPVLLPHLYNGRNRTFFFFSYEGTRNRRPETYGIPTVYSAQERGGDFSDLPSFYNATNPEPAGSPCGSNYSGPFGPNPLPFAVGSAAAGTPYCVAFPTGALPALDPLALKLMNQYVPLPNAPNDAYTFNPLTTLTADQYITRIDQNFGSQDSIWGYWYWERRPDTRSLPFTGATLPGFTEIDFLHNHQYALSWTHTFNPTTLNEARFGFFRINYNAVNPETPINPNTYGFTGINPQNPAVASIPVLSVTGYFNLGFSQFGPQPRLEDTYQVSDNFTKITGHHTVKAGFNMNRYQDYNPFYSYLSGSYAFNGAGQFSTGNPGADFLLGLPDSFVQSNGTVIDTRAREYYTYFQDEFKIRPSLTMTYGVGWDVESPYINRYERGELVNAWRPGIQSTIFPTAPTGVLWGGDPGINNAGGIRTPLHNFGPRLGFAWSPDKDHKWSIHTGFGMYYNRTEEEVALQNLVTPPFLVNGFGVVSIGGSPSLAAPYTGWCPGTGGAAPAACSTTNLFPYTPPAPGSTGVDFTALEPLTINSLSPNYGVPYSYNYNFTIERQLDPSTTISIAYVGNQARHLEGNYELNPAGLPPNGANPTAAALGCTPADLGTCAPQTFRYNPITSGLGAINQESTDFNSRYDALQVGVNKRLTHGFSLLASYTWSRFFDQNSSSDLQDAFVAPGINPFNFGSQWAPSNNDAPQRLVLAYDYTLPFYHYARRYRMLTDGWRIAGITTFQMGFPIMVSNSANPSNTCWATVEIADVPCWDRPNRVAGVPFSMGDPRTYSIGGVPNYWLNPGAFASTAPGTGIGNSSRDPFYGPGLNNFDLALYKDIHFTEARYIELRFETFNTFNHTQWFPGVYQPQNNAGGVVGDINDPRFGRVVATNPARIVQLAGKIYF